MNTISGLKLPMKITMRALIATAIAAATIALPATAHADNPAAHGVEAPLAAVPWSQVGPGWVLATWSPVSGRRPGESGPPGEPGYQTAATTLFALLFLLFLTMGFWNIRRGRIIRHREWMIRAFGVALGIATTRPIVGAFFAARRLSPHEFFGTAFWLGFTLTLLAAETWIHYPASQDQPNPQLPLTH